MDLREHPTWAVGTLDAAANALQPRHLQHAALWVELRVEAPAAVRRGHLQAVCGEGPAWRFVDLARLPLRTVAGGASGLPPEALKALEAWLRETPAVLYVLEELGAVSEVGESARDFRARVLGAVGAELRRGVIDAGRESAATVARLAGGVREVRCGTLLEAVRRAEVGPLVVPEGIELPARGAPGGS